MNSKPRGKVGVSQTDADKQFSTDKVVDVDLFLGDCSSRAPMKALEATQVCLGT